MLLLNCRLLEFLSFEFYLDCCISPLPLEIVEICKETNEENRIINWGHFSIKKELPNYPLR